MEIDKQQSRSRGFGEVIGKIQRVHGILDRVGVDLNTLKSKVKAHGRSSKSHEVTCSQPPDVMEKPERRRVKVLSPVRGSNIPVPLHRSPDERKITSLQPDKKQKYKGESGAGEGDPAVERTLNPSKWWKRSPRSPVYNGSRNSKAKANSETESREIKRSNSVPIPVPRRRFQCASGGIQNHPPLYDSDYHEQVNQVKQGRRNSSPRFVVRKEIPGKTRSQSASRLLQNSRRTRAFSNMQSKPTCDVKSTSLSPERPEDCSSTRPTPYPTDKYPNCNNLSSETKSMPAVEDENEVFPSSPKRYKLERSPSEGNKNQTNWNKYPESQYSSMNNEKKSTSISSGEINFKSRIPVLTSTPSSSKTHHQVSPSRLDSPPRSTNKFNLVRTNAGSPRDIKHPKRRNRSQNGKAAVAKQTASEKMSIFNVSQEKQYFAESLSKTKGQIFNCDRAGGDGEEIRRSSDTIDICKQTSSVPSDCAEKAISVMTKVEDYLRNINHAHDNADDDITMYETAWQWINRDTPCCFEENSDEADDSTTNEKDKTLVDEDLSSVKSQNEKGDSILASGKNDLENAPSTVSGYLTGSKIETDNDNDEDASFKYENCIPTQWNVHQSQQTMCGSPPEHGKGQNISVAGIFADKQINDSKVFLSELGNSNIGKSYTSEYSPREIEQTYTLCKKPTQKSSFLDDSGIETHPNSESENPFESSMHSLIEDEMDSTYSSSDSESDSSLNSVIENQVYKAQHMLYVSPEKFSVTSEQFSASDIENWSGREITKPNREIGRKQTQESPGEKIREKVDQYERRLRSSDITIRNQPTLRDDFIALVNQMILNASESLIKDSLRGFPESRPYARRSSTSSSVPRLDLELLDTGSETGSTDFTPHRIWNSRKGYGTSLYDTGKTYHIPNSLKKTEESLQTNNPHARHIEVQQSQSSVTGANAQGSISANDLRLRGREFFECLTDAIVRKSPGVIKGSVDLIYEGSRKAQDLAVPYINRVSRHVRIPDRLRVVLSTYRFSKDNLRMKDLARDTSTAVILHLFYGVTTLCFLVILLALGSSEFERDDTIRSFEFFLDNVIIFSRTGSNDCIV